MATADPFYADLAPIYHLIYPDWDASIGRQAIVLDSVIRELWPGSRTVLDVSCGIGTQSLGLASRGYEVAASDISPEQIERAKNEADSRGFSISFSVADMRTAFHHHARQFDVVLSCDNSVPHLLNDRDILEALRQFYRCTASGGGCIISVRDYSVEDLTKQQVKPYGIREENGVRWIIWQVWDPSPPTYRVSMYFVQDRGEPEECTTLLTRSTYYAIEIPRLMDLMTQAGFIDVRRIDGRFFQPMVVGTNEETG